MGLLLCRLLCCAKASWRDARVRQNHPNNLNCNFDSSSISTQQRYKVLLLGATGSGKTQVGHYLSGLQRDASDHGATNGVRYYRVCGGGVSGRDIAWNNGHEFALSEVGGSVDMQRLWSHYYASTLGLIFCFDLSASAASLRDAFALLEYSVLAHAAVRGKSVLLVATHAQSPNCEGLQLYDVENTFDLEMLARRYHCSLRLCYFDIGATAASGTGDLWHGVDWLLNQLMRHERVLTRRIKYDSNMLLWQQTEQLLRASGRLSRVRRQRFRRHRKLWPLHTALSTLSNSSRPRTAPSSIFSIAGSTSIGSTSSSGAQSETINPAQEIV